MATTTFWNWVPGGKACETCAEMAGTYHGEPDRPHDNCDCDIQDMQIDAKLLYSSTERNHVGSTLERVGTVVKGGVATMQDTWSVGASGQVMGSASAEGDGVKVGGSVTVGASGQVGGATTNTYPYQQDVGGECQAIFAVYDIYQVVETKHWAGPNFEWVTTASHTEREFRELEYVDTAALDPSAPDADSDDDGVGGDDDDDDDDGGGDDDDDGGGGGGDDDGGDGFDDDFF